MFLADALTSRHATILYDLAFIFAFTLIFMISRKRMLN